MNTQNNNDKIQVYFNIVVTEKHACSARWIKNGFAYKAVQASEGTEAHILRETVGKWYCVNIVKVGEMGFYKRIEQYVNG